MKSGYMYCPLSLTERQILIFKCLYERCDFKNMVVKYTTEQICFDVKLIKLTPRVVNLELKKLTEKGLIEVIKKGSKGNPSIYKIIKLSELNVSYKNYVSNLNNTNFKPLDSIDEYSKNINGNSYVKPIKESDSNINIENQCNELWSKYPKKTGKPEAFQQIPKLIQKYGYNKILLCIERYCKEVEGRDFQYIQGGKRFFTSGYENYLDDTQYSNINNLDKFTII